MNNKVLVWDFPVRIFHWGLAICFVGSWLTSESENYKMLHISFGYTGVLLLLFRIFWGFFGTKYANFKTFIYRFVEIKKYLLNIFSKKQDHYIGHNPAAGLMMLFLMMLFLLTSFSGFLFYKEFFESKDFHEIFAYITMVLVIGHVLAAILMSILEKQNLVKSMVTGKKNGLLKEGIKDSKLVVGIVLIVVSIIFFYLLISHNIPALTQ
jgi:cytochrome b